MAETSDAAAAIIAARLARKAAETGSQADKEKAEVATDVVRGKTGK